MLFFLFLLLLKLIACTRCHSDPLQRAAPSGQGRITQQSYCIMTHVHQTVIALVAGSPLHMLTATCFSFARMKMVTIAAAWTWRHWLQQLPGVITMASTTVLAVTRIATLRLAPPAQTSAPWACRRHSPLPPDLFFNYFSSPFI